MEKKEKRIYEPPQLTTVTFKVEQGFQASTKRSLLFSILPSDYSGEAPSNSTLRDYSNESMEW